MRPCLTEVSWQAIAGIHNQETTNLLNATGSVVQIIYSKWQTAIGSKSTAPGGGRGNHWLGPQCLANDLLHLKFLVLFIA